MMARMIAVLGLVVVFGGLIVDAGEAQSNAPQSNRAALNEENPNNLLARLSYDSTYVAEERGQPHFPRICFEVYRDGRYRTSRVRLGGAENLGGTLSQEQLSHVANLLKKVDFENKGGGVVRQGSETFVAEIVRDGRTARYIWVDPDHHRPFPESAESVIRWLEDFRAQGASALTAPALSMMQICPRMSENPLQPVTAESAECVVADARAQALLPALLVVARRLDANVEAERAQRVAPLREEREGLQRSTMTDPQRCPADDPQQIHSGDPQQHSPR
jgi:hypothetical protein